MTSNATAEMRKTINQISSTKGDSLASNDKIVSAEIADDAFIKMRQAMATLRNVRKRAENITG